MLMRNKTLLIAAILVIPVFSSCSPHDTGAPVPDEEDAVTDEAEPIGAVFTYNDGENQDLSVVELYLMMSSDPVNIPGCGFVKFKGAVTGRERRALFEVGGRGEIFRFGEKLGPYLVDSISADFVKLVQPGMTR